MKLTDKETTVYNDLISEVEDDYAEGFGLVYLDNAIDTSDKTVRGVLGTLAKKGLYEEVDGYAWGAVKL